MTSEKNNLTIAGYVLAGGGSTRFGRDKALVGVGGKPMLARMIEILQDATKKAKVVASRGKYEAFGVEIVEDRWPGEGPLGGIVTALEDAVGNDAQPAWNLIVSCDMPFLTPEWMRYMAMRAASSPAQVILPRSSSGPEPLCACWRTDAAETLRAGFEGGVRKVTGGVALLRSEVLDEADWKRFDSAGRLFWNMNTAADYEEAMRNLEMGNA
jgi:molybdopterin-guanine dinucleotide biosynthesis protein A